MRHYLDHFVVGISDLETGIGLVEEKTGVRPVLGGVHPHIGTHNALISLGGRSYLEIVAPDPDAHPEILDPQLKAQFMDPLKDMTRLTPFLWAAGSDELSVTVDQLRQEGIKLSDPAAGSREKPGGVLLNWRASFVVDPLTPGLPFFIQWEDAAESPAADSPPGCLLQRFILSTPNTDTLGGLVARLSLGVGLKQASRLKIELVITCPNGEARF